MGALKSYRIPSSQLPHLLHILRRSSPRYLLLPSLASQLLLHLYGLTSPSKRRKQSGRKLLLPVARKRRRRNAITNTALGRISTNQRTVNSQHTVTAFHFVRKWVPK